MYVSVVKVAKDFYRPQTKLRKGNVFTRVCQEFCPQGGVYPPRQTATALDDTHPTGMHSCSTFSKLIRKEKTGNQTK